MRRRAKQGATGHKMSDPHKKEAKRHRHHQDLFNKFTFQEIHTSRSKSRTWTLNPEVKDTKWHVLFNAVTKAEINTAPSCHQR